MLGAVLDGDVAVNALEFVVRSFVGILEAAPAADIVDEDGGKVGGTTVHGAQEFLQRVAAVDAQAALAGVRKGPDDDHLVLVGVVLDCGVLIFG